MNISLTPEPARKDLLCPPKGFVMSKNTHARPISTTERTKKSIADLTPKQWGNDPTELKLKWLALLEMFQGVEMTRRELLARQLIIDECSRLRQLEIKAGVK